MDTDEIETIEEPVEDIQEVEEETSDPPEPGETPFFRSWVWWCSLVAAVPGLVLAFSIVSGMANDAGTFNWMMWLTSGITFGVSATATVVPVLLALGKLQGGELVEGPPPQAAGSASQGSSSVVEQSVDDDFESDDDLFDSTDSDAFGDEDDDDDLDDFDDF